MTPSDERFLRRAIELAAHGRTVGDAPYGSLLVSGDGAVLVEAWNTVTSDRDISAHPELKLARWAARELEPAAAATTTMYTSCQPCGMCTGAIERSALGLVVYALSNEQYAALKPAAGYAAVPQRGPALLAEASAVLEGFEE